MIKEPSSENGNVFLAIFGAVAMVGILGAGIMNFSSGPVQNAINLNRNNSANVDMAIVGQLAIMSATNTPTKGDCDGDGYVEPPEMRIPSPAVAAGAIPYNGGYLPNTIGVSKKDPWGTEYGYCAWDHGAVIQNAACRTGATNKRLEGIESKNYPVIAVISAGPDKVFTTTCRNFSTGTDKADQNNDRDLEDISTPSLASDDKPLVSMAATTDDDIIVTYTYEDALSASGGLWKLRSSDGNTAYLDKQIEVASANILGTGIFERIAAIGGDFLDVVAGLKLADPTVVTTCNTTNTGILRRAVSGMGMEICNGTSWTSPGGAMITATQINDFSDGVVVNSNVFGGQNAGNETLTGSGNTGFGVSALNLLTTGNNNSALGHQALSATAAGSDNTAAGWGAGRKLSAAVASKNTALGYETLSSCTSCIGETAAGFQALKNQTAAGYNTAIGSTAMLSSLTGDYNAVFGYAAARTASAASGNTLIGNSAAKFSTTLSNNVGIGAGVMSNTGATSRSNNVAIGANAMFGTTTSDTVTDTVAVGKEAGKNKGSNSVLIGQETASNASMGSENVAIGFSSLRDALAVSKTVAIGSAVMTDVTGVKNTGIGYNSMVTVVAGSNNTAAGTNVMTSDCANASYNTVAGQAALRCGLGTGVLRNTVAGQGALTVQTGAKADNTAVGQATLAAATSGSRNTAFGRNSLLVLTTATDNTAVGFSALSADITGSYNTGVGYQAGHKTTGSNVTVVGYQVANGSLGDQSVAVGYQAMGNASSPTTLPMNVALGYQALYTMTTSSGNTVMGGHSSGRNLGNNNVVAGYNAVSQASVSNVVGLGGSAAADGNISIGVSSASSTGTKLTSFGWYALSSASAGGENTAFGNSAIYLTTGPGNSAFGSQALRATAANTAQYNVAVGVNSLGVAANANNNTAIGIRSLGSTTTGTHNVGLGYYGGGMFSTTLNNSISIGYSSNPLPNNTSNGIAIGNGAAVTANNTIRIGDNTITNISGQVAFTVASDKRLKKDIQPTDLGLDFILKLKPVSFRMIDGDGRLDYGFIAQDVEKALEGRKTNLITRENNKMQNYRMRSDDLLSPIVKAVQEQQKTLESLEKELDSVQ